MIAYYAGIVYGKPVLAKVIVEKETPKMYRLAKQTIDPPHPFFITGFCHILPQVKKSDNLIFLVREDAIEAIHEQFRKIESGMYNAFKKLQDTRRKFEEDLDKYERNKESNG